MPLTSKKFAPSAPHSKIARFSTGTASPDYDYILKLVSKERSQVRHSAIEAARVAANKKMTLLGEKNYFIQVKVYPHVILRENKMIATAGADRLQEGMRRSYGKPRDLGARLAIGSVVLQLSVNNIHLAEAKQAFKTAASKMPMTTDIQIIPLNPTGKTPTN